MCLHGIRDSREILFKRGRKKKYTVQREHVLCGKKDEAENKRGKNESQLLGPYTYGKNFSLASFACTRYTTIAKGQMICKDSSSFGR